MPTRQAPVMDASGHRAAFRVPLPGIAASCASADGLSIDQQLAQVGLHHEATEGKIAGGGRVSHRCLVSKTCGEDTTVSAFDTMRRGFMISFATAAPAVSAAFLASLVEVVEAFTIVLATGTLRGWRAAIAGTAAALAVL